MVIKWRGNKLLHNVTIKSEPFSGLMSLGMTFTYILTFYSQLSETGRLGGWSWEMISPKWASSIMSASYRLDLCFEQNLNIFYQGYFSLPTTRAIRISFLVPHSEKLVGFLQIKPREMREGGPVSQPQRNGRPHLHYTLQEFIIFWLSLIYTKSLALKVTYSYLFMSPATSVPDK